MHKNGAEIAVLGRGGVKVQALSLNDRPPSHIFTHAKLKI